MTLIAYIIGAFGLGFIIGYLKSSEMGDRRTNRLMSRFNQYADYVDNHAKFSDEEGKADSPNYNTVEVADRWTKYYELQDNVRLEWRNRR